MKLHYGSAQWGFSGLIASCLGLPPADPWQSMLDGNIGIDFGATFPLHYVFCTRHVLSPLTHLTCLCRMQIRWVFVIGRVDGLIQPAALRLLSSVSLHRNTFPHYLFCPVRVSLYLPGRASMSGVALPHRVDHCPERPCFVRGFLLPLTERRNPLSDRQRVQAEGARDHSASRRRH